MLFPENTRVHKVILSSFYIKILPIWNQFHMCTENVDCHQYLTLTSVRNDIFWLGNVVIFIHSSKLLEPCRTYWQTPESEKIPIFLWISRALAWWTICRKELSSLSKGCMVSTIREVSEGMLAVICCWDYGIKWLSGMPGIHARRRALACAANELYSRWITVENNLISLLY